LTAISVFAKYAALAIDVYNVGSRNKEIDISAVGFSRPAGFAEG
jgi:hypothetical protein